MQPDLIASRYRVVSAVGQGGMGTVWLCTDETLHRDVAVKQMGSLAGESTRDAARAMREARLAAALNHKNAVSIYDVVEQDGTTWLVMEYVPSRTLSQLLATEGRLPPERVAHIGAQVAAALDSAHSLGIIHRDVKPGNILVGEDDAAKISDFGIARGHQDVQLTQTGMVTGTPSFFAPEIARGEDPTFASDVWALGITLYTATEGAPPYEPQSNPLAMLSTITREPLPPPVHAGQLTGVLAGMLEPDASRRSTMAETLAGLREVEQPGGATPAPWDAAALATGEPAANEHHEPTSVIDTAAEHPLEPPHERRVMAPATSSGWSGVRTEDEPPPGRQRRFGRVALAALALLVLLGAGALLWNTLGLGADDQANRASTDSPTTSGPRTQGSSTPGGNATGTQQSPPASASDTSTTEPTDRTATSSLEDFTRSYFTVVPGDLDTGWSLVAPSYQREIGRQSYDDFWGSIESVDLGTVEVIDDDTVQYQITYTRTDGTTSDETKQLTLQPNGDSFLITGDTPAG